MKDILLFLGIFSGIALLCGSWFTAMYALTNGKLPWEKGELLDCSSKEEQ